MLVGLSNLVQLNPAFPAVPRDEAAVGVEVGGARALQPHPRVVGTAAGRPHRALRRVTGPAAAPVRGAAARVP